MVQISIHALKNLNHGGRFYPYSGFLGLTKVLVEGVARTRIDDDHKLLPAFSITVSVKCYEARTKLTDSRVNILAEVTQTLWSSPTEECSEIGDMDLPFRLVLPANIGGYSTLSFPDYKIFWRLEAVINHPPQFGLGMRQIRTYELALIRYNPPSESLLPLSSQQQAPILPGYRSSPPTSRVPQFFYRVIDAAHAVGPGDEYPVAVSLVLSSQHPVIQLQSLSISLERRVQLYEASGANSSTESIAASIPTSSASIASTSGVSANLSPFHSQTIALTRKRSASSSSEPVVLPAKSMTSSLVSGQTTEFKTDGAGGMTASLKLPLPARPSLSHWPIGESLKTDLAKICFVLRIKIVIISPSGTTEVELEPSEVYLAAISQEQRSVAAAKIARRKANSKSESSSRRTSSVPSTSGSSKAEPDTPPPIPTLKQSRSTVASTSTPRPHGSISTPKAKAFSESSTLSNRAIHSDYRNSRNTARPSSKRRPQTSSGSPSGSNTPVAGNTRNTRPSPMGITTQSDLKKMPPQVVLAWEEELHRIVTRSKRKSEDMWGSNINCDRVHHRTSRPRRTLAAVPPSAFTHPYSHPSETELFSRYGIATDSDNSIISPPIV